MCSCLLPPVEQIAYGHTEDGRDRQRQQHLRLLRAPLDVYDRLTTDAELSSERLLGQALAEAVLPDERLEVCRHGVKYTLHSALVSTLVSSLALPARTIELRAIRCSRVHEHRTVRIGA